MSTHLVQVAVLMLFSLITGCTHSMNPSDIQQNPHPKQRYEITMTIDGAPGPFESVSGTMDFEVISPDCIPQDPFTGARPRPSASRPIALTRVSENVYIGAIYLDLLQEGNYYSLGPCRWSATAANMLLKVHNVSFSPGIVARDIVAQKPSMEYFSKATYFDTKSKDYNEGGMLVTEHAVQNPDAFFSIELTVKESIP